MLETIHAGINSKTQDVVPLGKCTGKSYVHQGTRVCNFSSLSKKKKKKIKKIKKRFKNIVQEGDADN